MLLVSSRCRGSTRSRIITNTEKQIAVEVWASMEDVDPVNQPDITRHRALLSLPGWIAFRTTGLTEFPGSSKLHPHHRCQFGTSCKRGMVICDRRLQKLPTSDAIDLWGDFPGSHHCLRLGDRCFNR
jgi:hypothetical protein